MAPIPQLKPVTIDTPGQPLFDQVYECYSKVFTLENERESKENFNSILAKNASPEVAASKAKELWICLQTREGRIVGACNFDVFAGSRTENIDGTINAIYFFIDPAFRPQGIGMLYDEMHKAAANYIKEVIPGAPANPNVLIIAEQNSPFLMTARQYIKDNQVAGMDQVMRRVLFERAGFRTLDCRYIQPPLSAGHMYLSRYSRQN